MEGAPAAVHRPGMAGSGWKLLAITKPLGKVII
jgi:hypothetical protein